MTGIEKIFLFFLIVTAILLLILSLNYKKPDEIIEIKQTKIYKNIKINLFDKSFTLENIDINDKKNFLNSILFKIKLLNIPEEQLLNIIPRIENIVKSNFENLKEINVLYPWEIPLSNFKDIKFFSPIKNFYLRKDESIFPGAIRYYRHGIHRGIDFSDLKNGRIAKRGTPIFSIFPGEVVKIKNDHKEFTQKERFYKLKHLSRKYFYTHEDYLDFFRGNQIYIRNGSMFFIYAHLDKIKKGLKVGQFVEKGELIGYMGNTGVEYMGVRAHLHLEIYFGKFIIGLNRYRRSFEESFKIYKMLFNYKD